MNIGLPKEIKAEEYRHQRKWQCHPQGGRGREDASL